MASRPARKRAALCPPEVCLLFGYGSANRLSTTGGGQDEEMVRPVPKNPDSPIMSKTRQMALILAAVQPPLAWRKTVQLTATWAIRQPIGPPAFSDVG